MEKEKENTGSEHVIQSYITKNILKMRKWQFYKADKKQKEKEVHVIWSGNVLKTQSTKQLENQKNKNEEDVQSYRAKDILKAITIRKKEKNLEII